MRAPKQGAEQLWRDQPVMLSTGQPSTLAVWRANMAACLGENSPAVAFLDRKIEQEGPDEPVLSDESQTLYALTMIDRQER